MATLADSWTLYGKTLQSRLLLGTARYPSLDSLGAAVRASGAQILTVSLRRQAPERSGGRSLWQFLQGLERQLLPNTAGCHSVKEALALAEMARELFATDWIKLEVIGDDYNLQPDPLATVEAARELVRSGFCVFPYCTEDLVLAQRLLEAGCEVLMPWGAPIGTGRGLLNPYALSTLRERLPEATLIIDAGIGLPSDATRAMEMGYDGVLLNTAVAMAGDPEAMAAAFAAAVIAGRGARRAEPMPPRQTAVPSTPTLGTPFWHQDGRAVRGGDGGGKS